MSKPKLAIICSTDYKSYPMGGMMSFIVDLLPHLNDNFTITLLGVETKKKHGNKTGFIKLNGEKYTFRGFSHVVTGKRRVPNIIRVVYNLWISKQDIQLEEFDILYIHGIPLSFPLLIGLKKFSRVPKIVNHVHGLTNPLAVSENKSLVRSLLARFYEKYRQWVVRKSDLTLLASDSLGHKSFSSDYPPAIARNIKYVPNFADRSIFRFRDKQVVRTQLGISKDTKIFVSAGRLCHQKDPILSIEAFSLSKLYDNQNASLYIIGDGELFQKLLSLVEKKGLNSHVHFLGRLERTEIALWLNAADVYVYTSHGNGFPIALVEAGMCGLPVVTTDVTGVHDIVVHGETGFLVKERNPDMFSSYMIQALNESQSLSKNILMQSEIFTPERIAKNISTMLLSTLRGIS